MLLVIKCIFCYNCIVIEKEYWDEVQKEKSLGIGCYLYAIFETSDTGKSNSEDKSH